MNLPESMTQEIPANLESKPSRLRLPAILVMALGTVAIGVGTVESLKDPDVIKPAAIIVGGAATALGVGLTGRELLDYQASKNE